MQIPATAASIEKPWFFDGTNRLSGRFFLRGSETGIRIRRHPAMPRAAVAQSGEELRNRTPDAEKRRRGCARFPGKTARETAESAGKIMPPVQEICAM